MGILAATYLLMFYLSVPMGYLKGKWDCSFHRVALVQRILVNVVINVLLLKSLLFLSKNALRIGANFDNALYYNFVVLVFLVLIFVAIDLLIYERILFGRYGNRKRVIESFVWWTFLLCIYFLPPMFGLFSLSVIKQSLLPREHYSLIAQYELTTHWQEGEYNGERIIIHSNPHGGLIIHRGTQKFMLNIQTILYNWAPAKFYPDFTRGVVFFMVGEEYFAYQFDGSSLQKIKRLPHELRNAL